MKKLVAVASAGGHWAQLMRMSPVFDGMDVRYITTAHGVVPSQPGPVYRVTDANRWQRWRMLRMFLEVGWLLIRIRPQVVITTGAAPGLAAILWGRLTGATTIWVDSIANSEELSGSGRLARRVANLCLTQWAHLADKNSVQCWGAVL